LWSAVIDITGRPVKAMSRFGAEKGASISAPFERPCFENSEHSSAHTTKPRVRRYIVESDLTRVSDRAHCKDTVVIDCQQHRIARLDNPRPDDLRGLIGEPSRQDLRVVPVIGPAQFGNRSPEHLASGRSIFGNGVADLHATASCGQESLPKPSARSLSPTAASPAAEIVVVVLPGFRV
jgi:hypothetical protein